MLRRSLGLLVLTIGISPAASAHIRLEERIASIDLMHAAAAHEPVQPLTIFAGLDLLADADRIQLPTPSIADELAHRFAAKEKLASGLLLLRDETNINEGSELDVKSRWGVGFQALPFMDPATGLVYARERWLDPRTGTFLSPDPMGYRDSSNLYAFAGGDPVNRRDPLGLFGSDFHWAVTEFLGLKAGLHPHTARLVAEQTQHPDDVSVTSPFSTLFDYVKNRVTASLVFSSAGVLHGVGARAGATAGVRYGAKVRKRQLGAAAMLRLIHFPRGDRDPAMVEPLSSEAQEQALSGMLTGNLWQLGIGLHTLQDSFSHAGQPSLFGIGGHPWGRGGPASHAADLTHNDPELAMSAAQASYAYLVALGNTHSEHRVHGASSWDIVARELANYLVLRNRGDKRSWMEERGVRMPDVYWKHTEPGPAENTAQDRVDKVLQMSIDEKYLRRFDQR